MVVGASADGIQGLKELVRPLPRDLPAAIFVVLHTGPSGGTILPQILSRAGNLPAEAASDGKPIVAGRIYVAPADRHLLLGPQGMRVVRGPRENGFRPAVDPLFRSAARHYGARVVGIILSGMLDDGAFGLGEIVNHGGVALVQDPGEATFPDMPRAALRQTPAARPMRLASLAAELMALANGSSPPASATGASIMSPRHDDQAAGEPLAPDPLETPDRLEKDSPRPLGTPTVFTCPGCGGTLLEVAENQVMRYRCHVGHAFTPMTLRHGQDAKIEEALWNALRILEESASLRRHSAERADRAGLKGLADAFEEQAGELVRRAHILREVLERPIEQLEDEVELPAGDGGEA